MTESNKGASTAPVCTTCGAIFARPRACAPCPRRMAMPEPDRANGRRLTPDFRDHYTHARETFGSTTHARDCRRT